MILTMIDCGESVLGKSFVHMPQLKVFQSLVTAFQLLIDGRSENIINLITCTNVFKCSLIVGSLWFGRGLSWWCQTSHTQNNTTCPCTLQQHCLTASISCIDFASLTENKFLIQCYTMCILPKFTHIMKIFTLPTSKWFMKCLLSWTVFSQQGKEYNSFANHSQSPSWAYTLPFSPPWK